MEKLKWAFRNFEGVYGLKINYVKSELIPLNISDTETNLLANILQCKLDSLPMKYLGLFLHWKRPSRQNWEILIEKIQKRSST